MTVAISLADYWMGRDRLYPEEFTQEIQDNGAETVRRVNIVLEAAASDGVPTALDQHTGTRAASGWRPKGVNARTQNAADHSRHITAEGCDVQDTRNRDLARWCLQNEDVLAEAGLWIERPQWTGGGDPWVHFQIVPPKSGKRVFVPSSNPPIAEMLPEEAAFA